MAPRALSEAGQQDGGTVPRFARCSVVLVVLHKLVASCRVTAYRWSAFFSEVPVSTVVLSFALGLVAWTFLEYVIHAWLGHLPKGRILISSEHLKHHARILYFTPVALKVRGALPVLGVLLAIVGLPFGLAAGLGFVAAVALGWTVYEWLHQSIHVNGPTNGYSRWAARHHLHHHCTRPNRNYGVTTPIWDIVLRTYESAPRVRVSRRLAASIPWLAAARDPRRAPAGWMTDYEVV